MRTFLFKSSLIIGFIILLLLTSGIALAVYGPTRPGSFLFPVQDFAEQQMSRIYSEPYARTSFILDMVERRIKDLSARSGTTNELIAVEYLDQSITLAIQTLSSVPEEQAYPRRERLLSLTKQAIDAQNQLKLVPIEQPKVYAAFQAKLKALLHDSSLSTINNSTNTMVPPTWQKYQEDVSKQVIKYSTASGLIPFPRGSIGAIHAFYPLVGKHASLACINCHDVGRYTGTSTLCIECHSLKEPQPHFATTCDLCHTPASWTDIHFDHKAANVTDCISCHLKDEPVNHYTGQCSACHETQAWNIVHFDHSVAGATDCISCHSKDAPANHYAGQCSNCHDSSLPWINAHFNHSGFTDCRSCHANSAPANHYSGQCSNCHDPNTPWINARFNHSGFTDCISCHAAKAPANHFSGQCSDCHNTSSWAGAIFNHTGLTDCSSCHSGNAPANHYPYQCSLCHNTSSWGGAYFDHNSGINDCISCHLKDRPAEHDSGQCSNCHSTQGWGDHEGGGLAAQEYYGIFAKYTCQSCHETKVAITFWDIKQ